jgi:signal peptidase I
MLKKLGAFFLDIIEVVVFAIAIFLFVYLLVLQPHKIKGDSMQPNYPDGEFLLADKITYRLREPKRGDVVVFKAPISPDEEYIKRVVAVPGEVVKVLEGKVYINGKLLNEPYLTDTPTTPGGFSKEGQEIKVPNDYYFVLGDNRPASSDSRAWGFVPKGSINGRAWVVYYPIEKAGVIEDIEYSI